MSRHSDVVDMQGFSYSLCLFYLDLVLFPLFDGLSMIAFVKFGWFLLVVGVVVVSMFWCFWVIYVGGGIGRSDSGGMVKGWSQMIVV